MKRVFEVTLVNGRKYEIDARAALPDMPLGAKPTDMPVLRAASEISTQGFCPNLKDERPTWIAGSQIKKIDIVFEKPDLTVTK